MFEEYPLADCPIYMINIDSVKGSSDKVKIDARIGKTIAHELNLFFNNNNNVAVYVCDSIDERQVARKRKFDYWFNRFNEGTIIKEDGTALVEGSEIYNSILFHKDNKNAHALLIAYKELNKISSNK